MAQTIKLKRSATQGAVPSTSALALGEIAINTYDGNLFIKKNDGSESIVTIGELADNAVTSAKIAANAVEASEIATNAVGISELNVSDGTNGQVLTTDGAGSLSFSSKVSSAQSFYLNSATGDGSTTDFSLSTTPAAESNIIAFIDGVFQTQDSYTFSGTTLSFSAAPPNGTKVVVYVVGAIFNGNSVVLDTFSGDGSTTAFTLSENPENENNTQIYIDGVYQQKSEYSISSQTLTFSSAPPTGTNNIEVVSFAVTNLTVLNANSVESASIATGAVGTTELADDAVTIGKIADAALVIESEGISSNDNDTTLPTSAAVKDYVDSQVAGKDALSELSGDTDDVTEGSTNLYYTDARADARISNAILDSDTFTGALATNVPSAESTKAYVDAQTTDETAEGSTNLYYTDARADARIAAADTDDLSEGSTNLYYTDARVGTYISGNRTYGNITTTGYLAGPSTFTIDPAAVGDNTGTLVIAGNLQVDGTTTTINSTTLTVDDKLVTLASGSANAGAANGAGIEVDISGATNPSILYDGTNDKWDFNKDINVTGNITVSGTVDGRDLATDGTKLDGIESGATADQTQSDINALGITATGLSGTPSITVGTISSGAITTSGTFTGHNINLRNDTADDGAIIRDITFETTAAQGTDDRVALIRASNQGGDGTNRGGKFTFYTRQSGAAGFNSALILDKDGNSTFAGTISSGAITSTGAVTATSYNGPANSSTVIKGYNGTSLVTGVDGAGYYYGSDSGSYGIVIQGGHPICKSVKIGSVNAGTTVIDASRNLTNVNSLAIGTASTTLDLDVKKSLSGSVISRVWNSNTAGTGSAVLRLANSGNNADGSQLQFTDNSYYLGNITADRTNGMRFRVANSSDPVASGDIRLTINPSGLVGIGAAPQTAPYYNNDNPLLTVHKASGSAILPIVSVSNTSAAILHLNQSGNRYWRMSAINGGSLTFGGKQPGSGAAESEAMRILSDGDVRIGTTGTVFSSSEAMSLYKSGGAGLGIKTVGGTSFQPLALLNAATGTSVLVRFEVGNGTAGEINSNGTTTTYGQPSDYRLKENIVPLPSATAKVNALNPVRFNMIANPDSTTVDGFIAHEVQEIVPEAVSYEKDGMKEEEYEITPEVLDEDGNVVTEAVWGTRTVPQYQQMDASKLIPIMVKAIQEQQALIEAQATTITDLTNRIETLENA
jgi:hypothetical protein